LQFVARRAQFMRHCPRSIATRYRRAGRLPKVRFSATEIAARLEPQEPLMISRLTACAAVFAVLSAATITFASNAALPGFAPLPAATAGALPVVHLGRVEVVGRRSVELPRVEVTGRRAALVQR
jgi:hypothetical protein